MGREPRRFCACGSVRSGRNGDRQCVRREGRVLVGVARGEPARAPRTGRQALDRSRSNLAMARIALADVDGNQRRAAALIGMPLRTFVSKIEQYGLRPEARSASMQDQGLDPARSSRNVKRQPR